MSFFRQSFAIVLKRVFCVVFRLPRNIGAIGKQHRYQFGLVPRTATPHMLCRGGGRMLNGYKIFFYLHGFRLWGDDEVLPITGIAVL